MSIKNAKTLYCKHKDTCEIKSFRIASIGALRTTKIVFSARESCCMCVYICMYVCMRAQKFL